MKEEGSGFVPIRKDTLRSMLVKRLTSMIENHEYEINQKLPSELSLATSFNVSRTILREAMKVLENNGVIETINGRGTYVTNEAIANIKVMSFFETIRNDPSLDMLLNTRLIIEPGIAYRAALECTNDDICKLRDAFPYSIDYIEHNKVPMHNDDFDFHITIANITRNTILIDFLTSIIERLRSSKYANFNSHVDNMVKISTYKDHVALMEAIGEHQADAARDIMYNHLKRRLDIIKSYYLPVDDVYEIPITDDTTFLQQE